MESVMRIVLPGLLVIAVTLVSACAHTSPSPGAAAANQNSGQVEQPPRVPDEYLVKLAPDVDEAVIYEYFKRFGIKYVHDLGDETYLLILSNDPGPNELNVLIQNEARIKVVQPNLVHWDYRQ